MSFATVLKVITNYIVTTNSAFSLSPFGYDGTPVRIEEGAGFMTMGYGQPNRIGIGPATAHLYQYPGQTLLTFFTLDKNGSQGAMATVDSIADAFRGVKLDEDGATPDASSQIVIDFDRFGAPGIQAQAQEKPYLRTVFRIPWAWYKRQ